MDNFKNSAKLGVYHMTLKRENDDAVEDLFMFLIEKVNVIPIVD